MPPTFDPIPTARLRLRPFEANDLDDFLAYGTRPDGVRYLSWAPGDRAAAEFVLRPDAQGHGDTHEDATRGP